MLRSTPSSHRGVKLPPLLALAKVFVTDSQELDAFMRNQCFRRDDEPVNRPAVVRWLASETFASDRGRWCFANVSGYWDSGSFVLHKTQNTVQFPQMHNARRDHQSSVVGLCGILWVLARSCAWERDEPAMTAKRLMLGPDNLCQRGGWMERWQTVSQGRCRGTFRVVSCNQHCAGGARRSPAALRICGIYSQPSLGLACCRKAGFPKSSARNRGQKQHLL